MPETRTEAGNSSTWWWDRSPTNPEGESARRGHCDICPAVMESSGVRFRSHLGATRTHTGTKQRKRRTTPDGRRSGYRP